MRKIAIALFALIAVLAITLVVLPKLISWNLFKPEIAAAVRNATGRDFEIAGDIDVSLFPGLRFSLTQVRLGNAPDMSAQPMVSIPSLAGRLEFWPLLFGRLAIESLLVENPTVNLEVNKAGASNWTFDRSGTSNNSRMSPIRDLHRADVRVTEGQLTYTNVQTQQTIEAHGLQVEIAMADQDSPLSVVGRSEINGEKVGLTGLISTPGAVLSGRTSEVKATLESKWVTFDLESRIEQDPVFALDGDVHLHVASLGELATWLDRPLMGDPGPLDISAKVKHDGSKTVLEAATVEGTDLAANASGSMETSGPVTKLSLTLDSGIVDLDRYQLARPEVAREETRRRGEDGESAGLLEHLSAEPLDLQPLRRFEAEIVANVAGVKSSAVQIGPVAVKAKTQDGKLDVELSKLGLYGGTVSGTLRADALGDVLSVSTDLDVAKVDVGAIAQAFGERGLPVIGVANAKFDIGTRGASHRELAGNLLGEVAFKLSDGTQDNASTGLISAVTAKLDRSDLTSPLELVATLVYNREKIEIDVTANDVAKLLKRETFAVDGSLKSALGTVGYRGSVMQQPLLSFDGNFNLDVPSAGKLSARLGKPLQNDPGPVTLKAHLESDGVRGRIRTLSLKGTNLSAEATGGFDFSGTVRQFSLNVKGGHLDIDRYLPPQKKTAGSSKQAQAKPQDSPKDPIAAWSTEPLDLSPLRTTAADIVIAFDGLQFSGIEVAPFDAAMNLKEGVLETKASGLGLFGGEGTAKLSLDGAGDELAFRASATLSNAKANALNQWLDLEPVAIAGPTEATFNIVTRGKSPHELVTGLKGDVELEGSGLRVAGKTGPFRVSGQLGSASEGLALTDARGTVGLGSTELAATGGIEDLITFRGIDLKLTSSGNNLGELGTLVAVELPKTDSFEFNGRLTGSGRVLALREARLLLGRGDSHLKLSGKIEQLLDLGGIDLGLAAVSNSLSELGATVGADLPDLGPIEVVGRLSGSSKTIALDDFFASVDKSDFRGSAKMELRKRPKITLRLESTLLDLSPLMKGAKADEKEASEGAGALRFLESHDPLPFDLLDAVDADIALNSKHIRIQDAALGFGKLSLQLEEGALHFDKLEARYQETKLQGRLDINTGTQTVVASKFLVQGFDLGRFLRESNLSDEIDTRVDVAADLRSQGDSPHDLAANLEGSIGAVLGPGYFSHYLDLLAGGLTRQVTSIWGRNKQASELECAVILFDIREGVETSHAFFFETKLGVIKGKGQINLGSGTINFLLSPKPKGLGLLTLATPLHVTGNVWHPKVSPDTEDLVIKGVQALSTLVAGPVGLLVPFLHLGALDPHPCDLKSRESQILNIYE